MAVDNKIYRRSNKVNMNIQIAYLSPPFGPAMFLLKGVAPRAISIGDLYRSVLPFLVLQMIGLAIVMIFPQIANSSMVSQICIRISF